MSYVVYSFRNTINGMEYIGSCAEKHKLARRNSHRGSQTNQYVVNAIVVFGKNNFEFEVLHCNMTKDQAEHLESIEIRHRNTVHPNGYNATHNGRGGGVRGRKASVKTRSKISASALRGKEHPMHRPEVRQKVSSALKGKKLSAKHRAKLSMAHIGNSSRRLSPQKRMHIRYLWQNNLSSTIIASIVQVNRTTVYNHTDDLRPKQTQ